MEIIKTLDSMGEITVENDYYMSDGDLLVKIEISEHLININS